MPNEPKMDGTDKDILDFLRTEKVPCSVQEIADGTEIDWMTINNRLNKLATKSYVKKVPRPNKALWQFNFEKYKQLNKKNDGKI